MSSLTTTTAIKAAMTMFSQCICAGMSRARSRPVTAALPSCRVTSFLRSLRAAHSKKRHEPTHTAMTKSAL